MSYYDSLCCEHCGKAECTCSVNCEHCSDRRVRPAKYVTNPYLSDMHDVTKVEAICKSCYRNMVEDI